MIFLVTFSIESLLALLGFSPQIFSFLLTFLLACVILLVCRSFWMWKKASLDSRTSDPSYRLRLLGDSAATASFLPTIQHPTSPLQPITAISFLGISHFPNPVVVADTPPTSDSTPSGNARKLGMGPLYMAVMVLTFLTFCGLLYLARLYFFTPGQTSSNSPRPFFFTIGYSFILSIIVLAFITPTYLRISAHKLEVFRFGLIPKNLPTYESWDLSTVNLLANLSTGDMKLWDSSQPTRRGLQLRSMLILTSKERLARALFLAARAPTPPSAAAPLSPLPTDAVKA